MCRLISSVVFFEAQEKSGIVIEFFILNNFTDLFGKKVTSGLNYYVHVFTESKINAHKLGNTIGPTLLLDSICYVCEFLQVMEIRFANEEKYQINLEY